jgi:hypothetical protein
LRAVELWGTFICVAASLAATALVAAPAPAMAASPVLEFVTPGSIFPVGFSASGGPVSAALSGFDSVVDCSGSQGGGEITGPRSTLSDFEFTGCNAVGGTHNAQKCESAGAEEEEIVAEEIEADLVFIDQSRHEVGMLLNPGGGVYMTFECGGELVEASGPFLSPVGPINQVATSFTAILSRLGAMQLPEEYENVLCEKRLAIPMGERSGDPTPAATGVELSFAIHTSASLQIRAVTAAEIEAGQRADEAAAAAAAKKRQDEEAAGATAAAKRQEAEAATAAAVAERHREEARSRRLSHKLLSTALKQCRRTRSGHKRLRCERQAKTSLRPAPEARR